MRRCLRRLEERLGDGDDVEVVRKNFNELICLLDSPLFCQLLSVEDALDALQEASHDRSLDENDFDLDLTTGKLVLLRRKSDSDSSSCREEHGHVVSARSRSAGDEDSRVLSPDRHVAEVYTNLLDVGFSLDMLEKLAPGCAIESVTLDKPDGVGIGLGFGLVGLLSESAELGVCIQNIQRGGVADK